MLSQLSRHLPAWSRHGLAILAGALLLAPLPAAAQSRALALTWQGYADTDLQFSEFFNGDFTISLRFMAQYPNTIAAPMVSVNGTGSFVLGLDDFLNGVTGTGVLVQVASTNSPRGITVEAGKWYHLALVGQTVAGFRTFTPYLNGQMVGGAAWVAMNDFQLPQGTLRFGKLSTGKTLYSKDAQYYGLLDEVGVFTRALSQTEIKHFATTFDHLTGSETGLLAGFNFDGGNQPARLARPIKLSPKSALLVPISTDKDVSDKNAFILPDTQVGELTLPFKPGEAWYVIQGFDEAAGSHKGYASFCWDFMLADQPQAGLYPFGTIMAPFFAAGRGPVVEVSQNQPVGNGKNNPANRLEVQHDAREFGSYLHFWPGSAAVGGFVTRGQHLANAADTGVNPGAYHLHFAVKNQPGSGPSVITYPVVFTNYEVRQNDGTWKRIYRGIPQKGDVIRNPPPLNALYNSTFRVSQADIDNMPQPVKEHVAVGIPFDAFKKGYDELWPAGWRLHRMNAFVQNGKVLYNAIWHPGTMSETQIYGATFDEYKAKYDTLAPQGWRVALLDSYVLNGQVRMSAVWRKSNVDELPVYGLSATGFKQFYGLLPGWRIHQLRSYILNGQVLYNAILRPGNYKETVQLGIAFKDLFRNIPNPGFVIAFLQSYRIGNDSFCDVVWSESNEKETPRMLQTDLTGDYDTNHFSTSHLELVDVMLLP